MGNVIMSGIVPPLEKPVGKTFLSSLAEGSIIQINENGSPVDFYVAKHDYESGLNGAGRTLLVRKDCYDERLWDSNGYNTYATSEIDSWLNGTYKALLDTNVQEAIEDTEFYYTVGNNDDSVKTLKRGVFLLSVTEFGLSVNSYEKSNVEGSALPIASTLRVAYHNGSPVDQWTRSPGINYSNFVFYVWQNNGNYAGTLHTTTYVNSYGSRPCFTLPATALVAEDGTIIV